MGPKRDVYRYPVTYHKEVEARKQKTMKYEDEEDARDEVKNKTPETR